jgi:hypothetical protein
MEFGQQNISAERKLELEQNLNKLAVLMDKIEFTRENYDKLFPEGKVDTPLGRVKMGSNQLAKLESKQRQGILGGVYQTLTKPCIVIKEHRPNENPVHLYVKTFKKLGNEGIDTLISVIITKDNNKISISTHQKDLRNVLNKIKKPDDILYEAEGPSSED